MIRQVLNILPKDIYIYIAWHTKYFERVLEKLFWYLCLKFYKYSCQDISSILMSISRIAILQNIEGAYSLQLYERKNRFLFIPPGFSKLFRNTWFTKCCFEAASGQDLSGISWGLCKTISNHIKSNYIKSNIKPPSSSLLIMSSEIELALPVTLLNFPVEHSLSCSSVLQSSSFYLPINISLSGSVGLKKVTLTKVVTNKIWHLPHYIKPSLYHVASSLSRCFSVNKVLSNLQNNIG